MKKEEKQKLEKRLRNAQWKIAYYKMLIDGHADYIARECDQEIARLTAKRDKVLAEKASAPVNLAKYRREYTHVEELLAAPRVATLEDQTNKFLKLAEKLAGMEADLSALNLTPEQIELLRKMAELQK